MRASVVAMAMALDGVDLVMWLERDAHEPPARGGHREPRARRAALRPGRADARRARLAAGTWRASRRSSARRSATASSRSPAYPDALARVWSALMCPTSGEVLLSAAPGCEFADWGRQAHVGGGSHGSLHASDSLGALVIHGAKLPDPPPAQWAIRDVAARRAVALRAPGGAPLDGGARPRPAAEGRAPPGRPVHSDDAPRDAAARMPGLLLRARRRARAGGDVRDDCVAASPTSAPAERGGPARRPGEHRQRVLGQLRRVGAVSRLRRATPHPTPKRRSRCRRRTCPPPAAACRRTRCWRSPNGSPKGQRRARRIPGLLRRRIPEARLPLAGQLLLEGRQEGDRAGPDRRPVRAGARTVDGVPGRVDDGARLPGRVRPPRQRALCVAAAVRPLLRRPSSTSAGRSRCCTSTCWCCCRSRSRWRCSTTPTSTARCRSSTRRCCTCWRGCSR